MGMHIPEEYLVFAAVASVAVAATAATTAADGDRFLIVKIIEFIWRRQNGISHEARVYADDAT